MSSKKNRWGVVPTPLEIAILLTVVVVALATWLTPFGLTESLQSWGGGLWSLLTFMTQMCLVLLGGSVVATSRPVTSLLQVLARLPKTNSQVYLLTFLISALSCWLSWGLGLVVGAFLALEMGRQHPKIHFPLVVATSYMGFLFWHGGLSGSIPLVVATPGNFSEQWLGQIIPFTATVFSAFNLGLVVTLLFVLGILIALFSRNQSNPRVVSHWDASSEEQTRQGAVASGWSTFCYLLILIMLLSYLVVDISTGKFQLGLNEINFILIGLGLILHGGLEPYLAAVRKGCVKLAPILVQYPLYGGIMGVMVQSGLAGQLSSFFVSVSSEATYPVFMFLGAGLVNLFVPSGGGQWAVQAPIVIAGAKELGVPLSKVILAVAWGDAWTNLAQPFWALPVLSIVGLRLQDIMAYCLQALVVSGVTLCLFFLIF